MKQTVLYRKHELINAKMTDFAGWQVPLQFSDVQEEYRAVRTAAGLFDISFLGRIEVSGPGSAALLQNVVTWNMSRLAEGFAHYGLICNEAGCVLDDVLVIHLPSEKTSLDRYLLSTNAANTEKVLHWMKRHASNNVEITDRTLFTVHLSLQGPHSPQILEKLTERHFKKMKPRAVQEFLFADSSVIMSHTSYTGEHGYEFIASAERAESLWDAILSAGSDYGLHPCGFASRDILRLEMGHLLYGNELDETRTPLEAGLSYFIDFNKDFIGKGALLRLKDEGIKLKLAGFSLLDTGVPKSGGSIFSENREVGVVTSGCLSPYLRKGIGLGYIIARYSQPGQEIEIEVRDREIAAKIVDLPFYKKK
ncbi:MAG TPA: glycine cleavage system aminomethyltransferase GcvT [Nitrospirota bacterium]|nr:glycine cleavage system aminomethyltransferase GcvT [Nitrospirota bacterium]